MTADSLVKESGSELQDGLVQLHLQQQVLGPVVTLLGAVHAQVTLQAARDDRG